MQQIGATLRHAGEHAVAEQERRDMLAYVALCLQEIASSVDETCRAWEKRDYWVKADRFRVEWNWALMGLANLTAHLRQDELDAGAMAAARLGSHLADVSLPRRSAIKEPWQDAWATWLAKQG